MLPIQIAGIALAAGIVTTKGKGKVSPVNNKNRIKLRRQTKRRTIKMPTAPNPVHTLIRGLQSTISQILEKNKKEDYNEIIKGYLPDDSKLLKPEYPAKSREIEFADIDGDSQDEMIASYKLDDEIKTLIFKRESGHWYKVAEISNTGYDTINFRGFANVTGEAKQQLLLGLTPHDEIPELHGYSLENGAASELFVRSYHRFEVLNRQKNKHSGTKAQLAFWDKSENSTYDIGVHRWNGSGFEPMRDIRPYYFSNVVPYYARKVKQIPDNPSNWYSLAESLEKAGLHRDALVAVDVGMRYDRDSAIKERFLALRDKISEKY